MSNKIQEFLNENFGGVRAFTNDDKIWFCANDCLEILEYAKSGWRKRISRLNPKGVTKQHTLTEGGEQELNYINEPNLYRLVFGSKMPKAEEFQEWIYNDVIIAIRKTGGYVETNREEEFVNNAFDVEDEIKDKLIEQLKAKNQELEDKNRELEPMADYWSKFCSMDMDYTFTETCEIITTRSKEEKADINICVNKLTALLRDKGVLSKRKISKCYYNLPRARYREMFNVVPVDFSMGEVGTQTRVKGNGIGFIYELVKSSKDEDLVI